MRQKETQPAEKMHLGHEALDSRLTYVGGSIKINKVGPGPRIFSPWE